jgi:integrase
MAAYQRALAEYEASAPGQTEIGATRARPGSVAAAVALYLASRTYGELAPATKNDRRCVLERLREDHGDRPFAELRRVHVEKMLDKIDAPHARKHFLKALRALVAACLPAGLIENDPTAGVRVKVPATGGFRCWSEDDVAQFEARHPVGTKERLAFALLLHTGQRRGDVVRMGRQHLRGGKLAVKQRKTGVALQIPLHSTLQEILASTPTTNMTFLTTSHGQPFAAHHFTRWFRAACAQALLPPGLTAHGLRKACCRRLAEAGCTTHEIAAVSGHASLAEVARYTKAASQKLLAEAAMMKSRGEQNERRTGKPESPELANLSQAIESKGPKTEQKRKT